MKEIQNQKHSLESQRDKAEQCLQDYESKFVIGSYRDR